MICLTLTHFQLLLACESDDLALAVYTHHLSTRKCDVSEFTAANVDCGNNNVVLHLQPLLLKALVES